MSDIERQTFDVTGMTCEHCVAAVSAGVGQLPGVSGVDVDLASGEVAVTGSLLDRGAIRSAVEEAGYAFAAHV